MNNKSFQISSHWNGEEYQRISLPQYQINVDFLKKYHFSGSEIVLDIGCGDGKTTQAIAKKVPKGTVLGLDASSSMIQSAELSNQQKNTRFQLLNAQDIEFYQAFNLITCFFCLQWIPDKAKVFKKIFDALQPTGQFLAIVPLPHPYLPDIRKKLMDSEKWRQYFLNYRDPLIYINDTEYKRYSIDAGFNISCFCVELTPVEFPNYQSFFDFMREMTPHLSCLPTDEHKVNFLTELLAEYLKIKKSHCLDFNLVKLEVYRQ